MAAGTVRGASAPNTVPLAVSYTHLLTALSADAAIDARLLGFFRCVRLAGPNHGHELVRSVWRAEAELALRDPRFEIPHRRVVPAAEILARLWMGEGFEPIYRQALMEARLVRRSSAERNT
jgi:hypothetical protein